MKITKTDYMKILKYYNIDIPSTATYKIVQEVAEDILATKLCRCIKKINPSEKKDSKTVAICTNNVLKKKGLSTSKFTCKRGARFSKSLNKTRRDLTLQSRALAQTSAR